jgi:F0F1-type ATP synthase membrane subunit c/vacuolar-type H+-ATPase subunit K
MTVSSTRLCRSPSWLAALAALLLGFAAAAPAAADGIEVRKAALVAAEDGYFLEAQFDIALTPALEDALNKGVPLYFSLEFELIRPRWYWLDQRIASSRQQYRLSYNALARQYRVSLGTLFQNFASLREALDFLSRVRIRELFGPDTLVKGGSYTAALRLRLDTSQLPRPFHITAVGSRDWNVSSDWHRWTVVP